MDWFSYLLGLLTLPALAGLWLLGRELGVRLLPRRTPGELASSHGADRSSTLQFSPRLLRQIRHSAPPASEPGPPEALAEEPAKAS